MVRRHTKPGRSHHPFSRTRFAIPIRGLYRGQPAGGKSAPWFLQMWGSRPAHKLKRLTEAA